MAKEKFKIDCNLLDDITDENLDKVEKEVLASRYGKDYQIIVDTLKQYPKNDNVLEVAKKIAVVDITNSTHLHQYKEKINLSELANFIVNNLTDFDEQVAKGNHDIVNRLAKNTGKINLFSFATKYCFYHNTILYGRDDYAKFDGIVSLCLPAYYEKYNLKLDKKTKITSNRLRTYRKEINYTNFDNAISSILTIKNITTKNKKAKFDQLMWYKNK